MPITIIKFIGPRIGNSIVKDDFEGYIDTSSLDGQGGGVKWLGAWVTRDNPFGIKSTDDYESYSDTSDLNGLTGGTGWNGAFVSR